MFLAQTFKFIETDNQEETLVKVIYLKRVWVEEVRKSDGYLCEAAHYDYLHVSKDEATRFETRQEAERALIKDSHGWTKYHNSTYWPLIKKAVETNGVWGQVIEEKALLPNRNKLIQRLGQMYDIYGLSIGDNSVPFVEDITCGCQGCGNSFESKDVMIVDEVGPMCFRCLHNLAQEVLG